MPKAKLSNMELVVFLKKVETRKWCVKSRPLKTFKDKEFQIVDNQNVVLVDWHRVLGVAIKQAVRVEIADAKATRDSL